MTNPMDWERNISFFLDSLDIFRYSNTTLMPMLFPWLSLVSSPGFCIPFLAYSLMTVAGDALNDHEVGKGSTNMGEDCNR